MFPSIVSFLLALGVFVGGALSSLVTAPYENEPLEVYVKIIFNSVQKLDGVEQEFFADLFLEALWYDPRVDANQFEYDGATLSDPTKTFSPFFNFENGREVEMRLPPDMTVSIHYDDVVDTLGEVNHTDSGELWLEYNQRFIGRFGTPLSLQDFPFDEQFARVLLDSAMWPSSQVRFLPYPDFVATLFDSNFEVPEWTFVEGSLTLVDTDYPMDDTYSWLVAAVKLQRSPEYYMFKVVAGSILLVFMGILCFTLSLDTTDRLMGTITVFLALINFMFVTGNSLPKVPYLTRVDAFLSWSFFTVFLMALQHAIGYLYRESKPTKLPTESGWLDCLGLPSWSSLHTSRKADFVAVVCYSLSYSIAILIIFTRPVTAASNPAKQYN